MRNKLYFTTIILLILTSNIFLVIAQDNEIITKPIREGNYISEVGVEYDFEIVTYFDDQKLVEELISQGRVHTDSLEIVGNKTWIKVLISIKDSSEADSLISIFSNEEIRDVSGLDDTSPSKFSLKITKEGFDKLILDERVDKVYYDIPIYAYNSENKINLLIISGISLFVLLIIIIWLIKKRKKK